MADVAGAVETIAGNEASGVLFLCDHASNALPATYGTLGLPARELGRHIAYDIGAAWIARRLADRFAAPALLTTFSRLLIDPNRGADDPTLVMRLSDGAIVPGNARAGDDEIAYRHQTYWLPYRSAVRSTIDAMIAAGPTPAIVSVHSFTQAWKDIPRPWEIGILWDDDPRFAVPFIEGLRTAGFVVGDNEPYDGALKGDTLDEEVTRRGLAGLLIEVRQDLVTHEATALAIADHIAAVLAPILERPELHQPAEVGTRIERYLGQ